jgi:TldD protein
MSERFSLTVIDRLKDRVHAFIANYRKRLQGCHYIDVRLEVSEAKGGYAQNGAAKESYGDAELSMGIRVHAGESMIAPGYFGRVLGSTDVQRLEAVLGDGIDHAYRRAWANAAHKMEVERLLGSLSNALASTRLAPIPIYQDAVIRPVHVHPDTIPLGDMLGEAISVFQQVKAQDARVLFNSVGFSSMMVRELFVSSEGALIDQLYLVTQGFLYVVAREPGAAPESHYDWLGDLKGWEVLQGDNVDGKTFRQFAHDLTQDTIDLAGADVLDPTPVESTVVTDPHYNALVVHEIVGHPVEADRALKMETGYAGRTWLYRGPQVNMLGERIASELVTDYSDTSLQGFGMYTYDAEGVRAKRVVHIDKGTFKGFLNSRETAAVLGEEPNGAMRAAEPVYVPLVRMTNTVFASGDRNPQEIIAEVDDGYYLAGHRIPSISESRENFRITARKVYKIEHGELAKLYRSGGMTADSRDYLMSIDAVDHDFKLIPVPNCGKGQPMQSMRVGNGGPTMRGRAKILGGDVVGDEE